MFSYFQRNILVLGGTGYIGNTFLRNTKLGNEVYFYCIFRRKKFGVDKIERDNIQWIETDDIEKFDFGCLVRKNNIEYVLNFIGKVKGSKEELYYVNYKFIKNILDKLYLTGKIKYFINFSTTATLLPENLMGNYGKSKKMFDSYLIKSGISYVILKPSAVYGGEGGDNLDRYISMIRKWRICPVLGGGKNLIQPIEVGNVINIIDKVMKDPATFSNQEFTIVRRQPVTFVDFLKEEAGKYNKSPKIIKIPIFLCWILIKVQELIFWKKPFILWEQVVRSRANKIFPSSY